MKTFMQDEREGHIQGHENTREPRATETGMRGSEGGIRKRAAMHLAGYLPYFCLAFIGPKSEAIKRQLRKFLSEELKLNLSEEKTLITHARSDAARFLGYEVTTGKKDIKHCLDKVGTDRRSVNGLIGLRVPHAVILEKCDRYKKGGKPIHRAELLNESDFTIISTYQLEYRGIVEYDRLAYNLHSLDQLKWVMEQSLVKTLASKHKTSVRKIYKQYQTEVETDERKYKVLQGSVPREGKKPLVATWGDHPISANLRKRDRRKGGEKGDGKPFSGTVKKTLLAR